ncbi:hypothetical protein GV829_04660 [Sphingomonas lacunae]|uniref:Uncharacterized protein n=1 Tax=Sphingomonas lacunae TaxID=2698828 RepID=A0A6M4ARZ8_9SPHN|nr:hypothetical protein [Sphingomonas lacunae]QJQ31827.1 hypothetical protein GV829_04660 [Sphingomonas lacunae]
MASVYRPQIAPQMTSGALPTANPDSFGAGIGDAIAGIGMDIGQRAVREARMEAERKRDIDVSQAMAGLATLRGELDAADNEARMTARAGAPGHAAAMGQLFDERAAALLDSIGDPDVRARFAPQIAAARASFVSEADAFERGQTVRATVDNVGVAGNAFANRAARAATPEALQTEIDGFTASINALSLDGRTKAELTRQYRQQAVAGWVGNRPPEQIGPLLASGAFDAELTPQQQDALRNGADVEIRRRELAAQAEARAAAAAAKEEIDQLQREAADGIPIDPARLDRARANAATYGFTGDAYDMAKLAVKDALNREFRSATPLQIEQRLRALNGQIAQAGERAEPAWIIARDHLQSMLGARTTQVDNDPQAFGAALGIQYEPIDLSNRSSVGRRVAAARATAEATGRPPVYLSPQEVTQIQADMDTPTGRRQALATAQAFMGVDPQAVRQVATQLAPNDELFIHAAGLPGQVGGQVLEGRSLIGNSYTAPRALDAGLQQAIGAAMALMPPQSRNNVLAAARSLYAYHASRDNVPDTAESRVDPARALRMLHLATGATTRSDGQRQGGIGNWEGQPVLLNPRLTQREFESRMASLRTTGLFMRDGTEISGEMLRTNYLPVMQADGRYRFRDRRGGFAVLQNGRVGAIDLQRLGR